MSCSSTLLQAGTILAYDKMQCPRLQTRTCATNTQITSTTLMVLESTIAPYHLWARIVVKPHKAELADMSPPLWRSRTEMPTSSSLACISPGARRRRSWSCRKYTSSEAGCEEHAKVPRVHCSQQRSRSLRSVLDAFHALRGFFATSPIWYLTP